MDRPPENQGNLPRLNREAYRGLATVHWIFNIADQKTGWLNEKFFHHFQLVALHTFGRYQIAAPCICLMPDHIHFLLMGYSEASHQKQAVSFLRSHIKEYLAPFKFQKTPYDHVLRTEERKRQAFAKMAGYIRMNPFRAGLVESEDASWLFECCIVPGYPKLNVRQDDFWDKYWKIYYKLMEKTEISGGDP